MAAGSTREPCGEAIIDGRPPASRSQHSRRILTLNRTRAGYRRAMVDVGLIWDRALGFGDGGAVGTGPGDIALESVLLAHGMVMNGGVLHSVEALKPAQFESAVAGFRRLGAETLARLFESVRAQLDDGALEDLERAEALEVESDRVYADVIPGDAALEQLVRNDVDRNPGDYDPI